MSYFNDKKLNRLEINYFAPFTGYGNPNDAFNPITRRNYDKQTSINSIDAERVISQFYLDYKNEVMGQNRSSNLMSFTIYEPKVYMDIEVDSKHRMFMYMKDRIKEKEQDGILIVFLINESYSTMFNYENQLPYVNYIIFNE